jgi:hypothetical protein
MRADPKKGCVEDQFLVLGDLCAQGHSHVSKAQPYVYGLYSTTGSSVIAAQVPRFAVRPFHGSRDLTPRSGWESSGSRCQ